MSIIDSMFDPYTRKFIRAYSNFPGEITNILFKNGKEQAKIVDKSIRTILGIYKENPETEEIRSSLALFGDISCRLGESDILTIKERVLQRDLPQYYDINKENVDIVIAFISLNNKNNALSYLNESDREAIVFFADAIKSKQKTIETNKANQPNYQVDDAEYGLVPSKPIFCNMVKGSQDYLNNLRTLNNEKITWNRLGSTSGENGMVDIYKGSVNGNLYNTVYINMYSNFTSTTAPKGFLYVNSSN